LEDVGIEGSILKMVFKKQDGRARTGFIWFKIETNGRPVKY
jgi:hypothetical protein